MKYTLVADGSSDQVLMPILTWSLQQHGVTPILPQWAENLSRLGPSNRLPVKLRHALDLYPCDLLFVHRDAERESPETRRQEIEQAAGELAVSHHVPVIPVRMTEAWLLIDEKAIRRAAGNPNGTMPLDLPRSERLEQLPDPKEHLFQMLQTAAGLNRRRIAARDFRPYVHRIPEYMADYAALNVLPSFQRLQQDIAAALAR